VVAVNVVISLAINSAYVYVIITQSFNIQIVAVVTMALFKLLWPPMVVIPWLNRVKSRFVLVVIANISNVIIVPMLAAMAVDLSCFQSSFVTQPPIVTRFTYFVCTIVAFGGICVGTFLFLSVVVI
jgi:hypothetical protein